MYILSIIIRRTRLCNECANTSPPVIKSVHVAFESGLASELMTDADSLVSYHVNKVTVALKSCLARAI